MLAVGGENLIDLVYLKLDASGCPIFSANPGGSPFNLCIAASRQGLEVSYLTPISKDALGEILLKRLQNNGVEIVSPRVEDPTSLAVVSIMDGNPSYSFYRDFTAERQVTIESLRDNLPGNTEVFHVGSLGLVDGDDAVAWETLFKECSQLGILTTIDPNIRPNLIKNRYNYTQRILRMFQHADIVKLSDEDLFWLFPGQKLNQAISTLNSSCNADLIILTLGSEGSRGFLRSKEVVISAVNVEEISDTVGAGDTFMATILTFLWERNKLDRKSLSVLNEKVLTDAMNLAAKAAAINCQRIGCNPPSREDIGLGLLGRQRQPHG